MKNKNLTWIFILSTVILAGCILFAVAMASFFKTQGPIVFEAFGSADSRIYITNMIGFPSRALSPQGAWDVSPVLSPDGTKIAFECRTPDARLCIMNADGSDRIAVPQAGRRILNPSWSPDSLKVAFASQGVYVVNLDGSHLTQLTRSHDGIDYAGPVWSPDGNTIAYEFITPENWDIYTMHSDGSDQINITNHPAWDHSPSWSTDGRTIYFVSDRSGDLEIYRMNSDGSNPINLSNSPNTSDRLGMLSPDGQKIAFTVHATGADPQELDVYVMDSNGTNRTRLTTTPGYDSYPVWSPDGRSIAFISSRTGNWAVYVMTANGKYQTRISHGFSASGLSWSP